MQNVTIPSGATNASFSVAINNDNTLEDTEEFTVTITSTSLPSVTVDGSGKATVDIVDDDGKQLHTLLCNYN